MFGNVSTARLRRAFADQFVVDGSGYIYRKYSKGPAFRVTRDERDQFISDYQRRLRYASWGVVPATIMLVAAVVLLFPDPDAPAANLALYAGIAAILALFVAIFVRAWNAPARKLERRAPAAAALPRQEARKIALSKLTYGQLATGAGMGLFVLWQAAHQSDIFHGWGLVWPILCAAMITMTAIQALRKWRFERNQ